MFFCLTNVDGRQRPFPLSRGEEKIETRARNKSKKIARSRGKLETPLKLQRPERHFLNPFSYRVAKLRNTNISMKRAERKKEKERDSLRATPKDSISLSPAVNIASNDRESYNWPSRHDLPPRALPPPILPFPPSSSCYNNNGKIISWRVYIHLFKLARSPEVSIVLQTPRN